MCNEQRATFAKVKIEDDGTAEVYYSANIRRRTAILATILTLVTIVTGMLTVRQSVIDGVRELSRQEFRKELDAFHTVAKPEIYKAVDEKIELNDRKVEVLAITRAGELKSQMAELKTQVEVVSTEVTTLTKKSDHQTELLEELLRRR